MRYAMDMAAARPTADRHGSASWPARRPDETRPNLSRVVYRSRAVQTLSSGELASLMATAQQRNGREGVTGLLFYDNDRFFQWLEGPPDSVGRVMESIRGDPRHTEVEILEDRPLEARRFADWSMKLATPRPVLASWGREVIDPPPIVVETLRHEPEAAPRLLLTLVPEEDSNAGQAPSAAAPLGGRTAEVLRRVFLSAVLPQMLGTPPDGAEHPRSAELADLLVFSDDQAVTDLLVELRGAGALAPLHATLLEPAARRLGDMWDEDSCSEFDVTLGLCRLQTAVRLLGTPSSVLPGPGGGRRPLVLITPEPGELHRLGAVLDDDALRMAGWSPRCAYPADDDALQDLLASEWFDALDLSLSTASRREHWLPRVTETIAQARRASRNPGIAIIVGGRVFREQVEAGGRVGADLATTSSADVVRSVLAARSVTAQPLVSVT